MSNIARKAAEAVEARQAAPSVTKALDQYTPNLQAALPSGFPGGVKRFQRIVRTAVNSNPDLLACDPITVVAGAIQAAQLGLTPNLQGQCWLIPRRNKDHGGRLEATFQVGYRGLIELAARADVHVRADVVKHGDYYVEESGLTPRLEHVKAGRGHPAAPATQRGDSWLWYAIAESALWSVPRFAGLDRAEVERFRQESPAKDAASSPWRKWYDEMAMSKAIRVALRYARVSVQFERAMGADESVLDLEEVLAVAGDAEQDAAQAAGEVVEASIAKADPQ